MIIIKKQMETKALAFKRLLVSVKNSLDIEKQKIFI